MHWSIVAAVNWVESKVKSRSKFFLVLRSDFCSSSEGTYLTNTQSIRELVVYNELQRTELEIPSTMADPRPVERRD